MRDECETSLFPLERIEFEFKQNNCQKIFFNMLNVVQRLATHTPITRDRENGNLYLMLAFGVALQTKQKSTNLIYEAGCVWQNGVIWKTKVSKSLE